MFCSRCGKKVLDSMLFCPFCGSEIIIPDQDAASAAGNDETEPTSEPRTAEVSPASVEPIEPEPGEPEPAASEAGETDLFGEPDAPVEAPQPQPKAQRWDSFEDADEDENDDDFFDEDDDGVDDTAYIADAQARRASRSAQAQRIDLSKAPAAPARGEARPASPARSEIRPAAQRVPEMRRPRQERPAERPQAPSPAQAPRASKPAPAPQASRQRRSTRTIAPAKAGNPDDMFMDEAVSDRDEFDTYDAYDDSFTAHYERRPSLDDYPDGDEDDEAFDDIGDDDEKGSFIVRHMRALVGIILFVVLILIIVLYGLLGPGQEKLARINATLPIDAKVYAKLGKESYDTQQFQQAGVYFERALARNPKYYKYAESAVMCYKMAGNTNKEVEMLKKCIEINPNELAPYIYLLDIYPNANERPMEIQMLLQQGYQNTGDSRLAAGT